MAIKFFAFFFRQSVLSDVFGLSGRHHWQSRAAAQRCGAGGCRREATWINKNPIIIPCPDSAGARKGPKGSRKRCVRAVFGYHNFGQPPDGVEKLQNALVRGRQVCIHLSILEGSLAELLGFWCCQLWKIEAGSLEELFGFWRCQVEKLMKSPRIAAFWCCQVQKLRKSRRISSLQIDR